MVIWMKTLDSSESQIFYIAGEVQGFESEVTDFLRWALKISNFTFSTCVYKPANITYLCNLNQNFREYGFTNCLYCMPVCTFCLIWIGSFEF